MFVHEPSFEKRRTGRPPAAVSTAFERVCPHHGPSIFHRYGDGRVRCKRCVGDAVTRRHRRVKRMLVEEAGGCCAICGYDRTVINLHFHHVDPAIKRFNITMGRGKSIATYREESRKCVLVCANCHGEIEAGLVPSPPPQARYRPTLG